MAMISISYEEDDADADDDDDDDDVSYKSLIVIPTHLGKLIRAPSCNFDLLCSSLIRFAEDVLVIVMMTRMILMMMMMMMMKLIRAPSFNFDLLCSSPIRFAEDAFGDNDVDEDDIDDLFSYPFATALIRSPD